MIAVEADVAAALLLLEASVREMRDRQRAYFKGRTDEDLRAAKKCERKVDEYLGALDRLRNPPPPPAQADLFGGRR